MPRSVFTPEIKRTEPLVLTDNNSGLFMRRIAQYTVILLLGLIPIFFVPGLWASLGFGKILLAMVGSVVVVVLMVFLILKRSHVQTVLPVSLGLFWLLVLSATISGFLSGDAQDSLWGSVMEIHTVGFMFTLGMVMTIPLVLQGLKSSTIKALALFGFSATLILLYNLIRIFLGGDFLAFSSFSNVTTSPIGGFNDLAIFSGLIIILSLITLVQLPLKAVMQYFIASLVIISLVLLSIINFFNIWVVVGFFGLLMLIYLLSRNTLFPKSTEINRVSKKSRVLLVVTVVVCIFSTVFIVAGDYAGNKISQTIDTNFVEVKPSLQSTIDIADAVYQDNALLGVGPNRFVDAWRQYKEPALNETIFWDTDFTSGSGYIPTLFVNLGLLGGLLILAFHLSFLRLGYRMLLKSINRDSYWYYFGMLSFAAASFIWGMTYVYVPGVAVLLLAALFTGLTFVAAAALLPQMVRKVPLVTSQSRGFLFMGVSLLVVTISVVGLYTVSKQYVAQAQFTKAQVTAQSTAQFELIANNAFDLFPDDRFVNTRSQLQLAELTKLMAVKEPSEAELQKIVNTAEQAMVYAKTAVDKDPTNPDNHILLARIYGNLALLGVEGARERAELSLQTAEKLEPLNPSYKLLSAQIAVQSGDTELARTKIAEALKMKRNYTEALFLLAQIDISEGNTASAIETTRSIITLEPNNPTRYLQLGVLLSSSDSLEEAIIAYKEAIRIDPAYANARYLLALAYIDTKQFDSALTELYAVQKTNPNNSELASLIQLLESGDVESMADLNFDMPVNDITPATGLGDTVIVNDVDTDLVTPVNTVSKLEDEPLKEVSSVTEEQNIDVTE